MRRSDSSCPSVHCLFCGNIIHCDLWPRASLPFLRRIRNIKWTCFSRFKAYLEPQKPYNVNRQFFYVMLCRLIFVLVFQYIVFLVKDTVAYIVPDIPSALQVKIAWKMHVARMCFRKSAVASMREMESTMSRDTFPRTSGSAHYDSKGMHFGNSHSTHSSLSSLLSRKKPAKSHISNMLSEEYQQQHMSYVWNALWVEQIPNVSQ